MDQSRFVLTDRQWHAIEPHCPGGASAPGRTGNDTRLFLEAVLWMRSDKTDTSYAAMISLCAALINSK